MENPSKPTGKCSVLDRAGVREGLSAGIVARQQALANPGLWMLLNGAAIRWDVLRARALAPTTPFTS